MLHAFASVPALNKFHAEKLPKTKTKTVVMHFNLKKGSGCGGKSTQGTESTSTAPSKILTEKHDPNYEPTKEEVDEYAEADAAGADALFADDDFLGGGGLRHRR